MKQLLITIGMTVLLGGCAASQTDVARDASAESSVSLPPTSSASRSSAIGPPSGAIIFPITRATERVTRKPFGIHITKASSPVQPERFGGYHAGTDFEVFDDEQNMDVAITALCDGAVRFRGWLSGYGGLLVQECTIEGKTVTVLYGHLAMDSVTARTGDMLKANDHIGILGEGYTEQTDGERKHLHLGIHRGSALTYRGYVEREEELAEWIDPLTIGF